MLVQAQGLNIVKPQKSYSRSKQLGRKRKKILKFYEKFTNNDNKKRVLSQATRLKQLANNHKSIAVIIKNIDTGVTYKSLSKNKAAQFLGISQPIVHIYIKQQRVCKGYIISIE